MSRLMTKPTNWHLCPAKTQISLSICPVWSESSLSAWRKVGPLAIHWMHSKDSDQTGRMPRLIWVFSGCTVILLVLSWGSSYNQSLSVMCKLDHILFILIFIELKGLRMCLHVLWNWAPVDLYNAQMTISISHIDPIACTAQFKLPNAESQPSKSYTRAVPKNCNKFCLWTKTRDFSWTCRYISYKYQRCHVQISRKYLH